MYLSKYNFSLNRFKLLNEFLVFLAVWAATGGVFYLWLYAPSASAIRNIRSDMERLATVQASAGDYEREIKRLQYLNSEYEKMKTIYAFPEGQLRPEKEVSDILRELSLSHSGVTLLSVQTSPLEDKKDYLRLPMALHLRGDFPSIGAYLASLEGSKRILNVENVSMVKEEKNKLSVRLDISVYLIKEGPV